MVIHYVLSEDTSYAVNSENKTIVCVFTFKRR